MAKLAFGIDLGTTNSAISVVTSGVKPEIISCGDKNTIPSCVMWNGGDNFIVGEEAYDNFEKPNVAHSFKKLMGSDEKVELEYNGEKRLFSPEELSAEVLKKLCVIAEPLYGKVEDVVITVPAYFTDDQVTATRKAGELAGLNVISTFREPVASALVYINEYADKIKDVERMMVYDLGGGTFDVSIVDVHKSVDFSDIDELYGFSAKPDSDGDSAGITLNVKGKYGDMKLGGDDIDNYLLEIMLEKIERLGYDTYELTPSCKRELLHFCEEFKKSQNSLKVVKKSPIYFKDGTSVKNLDIDLDADDLQKAVYTVYRRTQSEEARDIIEEASQGKLDSILLIGGSTKSKYIEGFLRMNYPGVPINKSLSPDEAVCLGAGLQAHRLLHGNNGVTLNDVLPLPIGVLANGRISKILPKDVRVPAIASKKYLTQVDDQEILHVDVYQGTSLFPEDSHHLGRLVIDDLPKGKAGSFPITVQLVVNFDGVLSCDVIIKGKKRSLQLTNVYKGLEDSSNSRSSAKPDREERFLVRFRRLAKNESRGAEILAAIDEYTAGKLEFQDLVVKVNELRDSVSVKGDVNHERS